jgi:hypothetical protein
MHRISRISPPPKKKKLFNTVPEQFLHQRRSVSGEDFDGAILVNFPNQDLCSQRFLKVETEYNSVNDK